MPSPRITPQGKAALDALLEKTVATRNLPAVFFMVTTADGPIYFECKGEKVFGKPEEGEVNADTTVQMFSMTKLVTSIACLQLAEKGLVDFDDPEVVNKYCPELVKQPILESISADGTVVTRERTNPITLRHLLTHTAGLAYNFISPLLLEWEQKNKHPGFFAPNATEEAFATPLLFEPGTSYTYSTGIDWAGIIVQRVTGKTLGQYFEDNIFKPIGINPDDISFYPTDSIKERLMHMTGRDENGNVILSDGWRPIPKMTPEMIGVHSGGAGLLGTLKAYLSLLQHVLQCQTKDGIITTESYKLLFTNALPPRGPETTVYEKLGEMLDRLGYNEPQQVSGKGVSHSLGLLLNDEPFSAGRPAGCGAWGGAAKTQYWIDPTNGIAAMAGTNILELEPHHFYNVLREFERTVYDALDTDSAPPAAL